jgi:hypothetical protein
LTNQRLWFLRKWQIWKAKEKNNQKKMYQHGVPTKVFLERCLSPVSNMHADTPKSASLTAPLESIKIFPACKPQLETLIRKINTVQFMRKRKQD